jgi:hypothetical protein
LSIMKGGIAYLSALMLAMAVAYSLLPGWIAFGRKRFSEAVTTMLGTIWPIMKPVLLKFYVLLSRILCLALVLPTSSNQACTLLGSLQRALL